MTEPQNADAFSLIVFHMSLQTVSTADTLGAIAEWCYKNIKKDGRIVVGLHNRAIALAPPAGFEDWRDHFRETMETLIDENPELRRRLPKSSGLNESAIERAFTEAGFAFTAESDKLASAVFPLSLDDRRLLWRCPVVAASIVENIERISFDTWASIVDKAFESTSRLSQDVKRQLPKSMMFWRFRRTG